MDCPREVKNLYVTSSNRNLSKDPYGNSYTLYLTTPIKDITTVELLYASIPNTMYNVNNGINVIGFTDIANVTANVVLSTIPPGFYGAGGISSEIMNATYVSSNVCMSFLPGEGRFLFTRNTGFTMNVMTQELSSLLGFDYPCSINATNSATQPNYANNLRYKDKWYIKSKYVIDMNAYDGIFLDIQELRSMYNECAPQGSPIGTTNNNTANRSFGLIPMDVISGTLKRFKKENDFDNIVHYPYPIQKLDRLTSSWTDKSGNLLSFNGAEDNSFILRFHTLRKNLC
jgi:hypothetical protein